jgi:LmbE family N-acetylglucosaminyl deacetylase
MEQEIIIKEKPIKKAAVIVAHPDDETLWSGGTILLYPKIEWTIITLCRASDPDRAPKFFQALNHLNATGAMGDLDDGPQQKALSPAQVQQTILSLLPSSEYDLILSHSPYGEYTRHLRHEEAGRAAIHLFESSRLLSFQLWLFAYEDGHRRYLPRPIQTAHRVTALTTKIWKEKYRIITDVYGFFSDSFEAKSTPKEEAFWCFSSLQDLQKWISEGGPSP